MKSLLNLHSHDALPDSIVSLTPEGYSRLVAQGAEFDRCSVGIHPWDVGGASAATLERWFGILSDALSDPRTVAVGEAGIDTLAGGDPVRQEEVLRRQIEMSERSGMPLVLHVVKGVDPVIRLRMEMRPRQPWIVHGFRGKPQMARSLVDRGLYLSLGAAFNPETARVMPLDRLLVETDESPLPVGEVIGLVARARGVSPEVIEAAVRENLSALGLR